MNLLLPHRDAYIWLTVATITLAGLGLRLWAATHSPLWLDEVWQWIESNWGWKTLLMWGHEPNHAPLSHLLNKAFIQIFGHSELSLRSPYLLLSTANIVFSWFFAHRFIGKWGGLTFCFLMAMNPVLIEHDAMARMYTLWLSTSLLGFIIAARIEDGLLRGENAPVWVWTLAGVSYSLMFWTHPLAIFFWAALSLGHLGMALAAAYSGKNWSLLKDRIRGLLIANSVGLLLSYKGVLKILAAKSASENTSLLGATVAETIISFLGAAEYPLVILATCCGLWLLYRTCRPIFVFSVLTILSSIITVWLVYQSHFITARYLYPMAIPLFLSIAAVIERLFQRLIPKTDPSGPRYVLITAVAAILLLVCTLCYRAVQHVEATVSPSSVRFEIPRMLQFVAKHAVEEDYTIYFPKYERHVARYYKNRTQDTPLDTAWSFPEYGYDYTHLNPGDDGRIWILIQSNLKEGRFREHTEAEFHRLLSATGLEISPGDVETLLNNSSIVLISGNSLCGMDLSRVLNGNDDLTQCTFNQVATPGERPGN